MRRRASNSRRCSCPAGKRAFFRTSARSTNPGRAGLEEERRLAYVGLTRAKRRAKIYFATNRRIRGLWQTTLPSRFLDELPAAHVEVVDTASGRSYGNYAQSRFANMDTYRSSYATPGWQRAQRRSEAEREAHGGAGASGWRETASRRGPLMIEGELVAKSSVGSAFAKGARVFHMKFGPGTLPLSTATS